MDIAKKTIKASPYLGVFAVVTDDIGLFPEGMEEKERKGIEEFMGIEVIETNIANSSLIGVFTVALGRKLLAPGMVEKSEKKVLEERGIEVMELKRYTALGNLIALNEKAGIASPMVDEKSVERVAEFFGVRMERQLVAGTELAGACLVATNKGFLVHPNATKKEFEGMKKLFQVNGSATTANYGDPFVGNGVLANGKAAMAGLFTSGPEMMRIDEGLRGE